MPWRTADTDRSQDTASDLQNATMLTWHLKAEAAIIPWYVRLWAHHDRFHATLVRLQSQTSFHLGLKRGAFIEIVVLWPSEPFVCSPGALELRLFDVAFEKCLFAPSPYQRSRTMTANVAQKQCRFRVLHILFFSCLSSFCRQATGT